MGINKERLDSFGISKHIELKEILAMRIFVHSESLCSTDTYHFDDYSKYAATIFDPEGKTKRRKEVFPLDYEKSFEMSKRLVSRQKVIKVQK
jgi:hypothetical protein